MNNNIEKLAALSSKGESYTERFLRFRIELPPPFTFVTELALWALAAYGAFRLF